MRSCLAGWQDIFSLANRILLRGGLPALYHTRIVSVAPRQLLQLRQLPAPAICLAPVMLGENFPDLSNQSLQALLMEWHIAGVLLGSACAGSFILAASGILDNKTATTHWTLADTFRRNFPQVRLDIGELLVDNPAGPQNRPGAVLCGGGISAYFDLGLAIVAKTGGSVLAEQLSRTLLWDPHRPRQALYANSSNPPQLLSDEIILKAQAWALSRLGHDFSLTEWAHASGLELRSFERRFQHCLGVAPGLWLRQSRLKQARELLASSRRSWQEISANCAYQDPGNFRTLFQREFGISPMDYRRRFQQA